MIHTETMCSVFLLCRIADLGMLFHFVSIHKIYCLFGQEMEHSFYNYYEQQELWKPSPFE